MWDSDPHAAKSRWSFRFNRSVLGGRMEATHSRSEYRSSNKAREAAARGPGAKARERRRRRLQRQLSQQVHWALYVGAGLLAAGVISLVAAALLTR